VLLTLGILALTAFSAHRAALSADDVQMIRSNAPISLVHVWTAPAGSALPALSLVLARGSVSVFGPGALGIAAPAIAATLMLTVAIFLFTANRASARAAGWAALAVLGTGAFRQFNDPSLPILPGALLAISLVCADAMSTSPRLGWIAGYVLSSCAAVYLDSMLVFAIVAAGGATLASTHRPRGLMPFVALVAIVALAVVFASGAATGLASSLAALMSAPLTAIRQPVYALAFLQTSYGRVLGLLTPLLLLLFAWSVVGTTAATVPSGSWRTWLAPSLLALVPVWALAPLWALGRQIVPGDLLPASIGCCVLLGCCADRLVSPENGRLARAWTVALALAALVSATIRDPAVTLRRDVLEHRSRFALLDWARQIDSNPPIVIANHAVYLQLLHYAPAGLAARLVYIDVDDESDGDRFTSDHRLFYVFEGAETRSPLLGWLARRHATLSEARSWSPKDLAIDAPAYLYRVQLN
jgi:hypothetical protein